MNADSSLTPSTEFQNTLPSSDPFANRPAGSLEDELRRLSFLSHDLANNLNVVSLHLELLKGRLAQSAEYREEIAMLDLAEDAICRTVRGTQRLLRYEKLRRRGSLLDLGSLDLAKLVIRVASPYFKVAQAKGLHFLIEIPGNTMIRGDEDFLGLVLQNLLDNSVKFSNRGIIRISSKNVKEPNGSYWILSVSDQGFGIQSHHLTQIFEAFHRGDDRENGVGLGLAIALEAARILGSHISVDSQSGVGSTFSLKLSDASFLAAT
jgi:signal transduction histidine kinase